jgi:hypothetical protein
VPLFRVAAHDPPPAGVVPLPEDGEKGAGEGDNADVVLEPEWAVVGITPGGVYGMLKKKWPRALFGHGLCDLLVLQAVAHRVALARYGLVQPGCAVEAPLVGQVA